MDEDRLLVGHLTLQLPPGVPLHERGRWGRRAASALDAAMLEPRSLPPRAMLVVRRLVDPRPGVLLDQDAPPWQAGARWGEAAREAIEACWRNAARPLRGPVPAHAPAVWFADRAEWLACLSVDLNYGVAAQRWWWRAWLSQGRPAVQGASGGALAPLWVQEARWVPPALALLAVEMPGVGAALVGALSPAGRERVRAALAQVYALPSYLAREPTSGADVARDLAAWSRYIPGGPGPLPHEPGAGHLLAFALALYHAPAAVGAGRVGQEPDRPAGATTASRRTQPTTEPGPPPSRDGPPWAAEDGGVPGERGHRLGAASDEFERLDALVHATDEIAPSPASTSVRPMVPPARGATPGAPSPARAPTWADAPGPPAAEVVTAERGRDLTTGVQAASFPTAEVPEAGLRTELGGVFYLINVLVELGLFADDGAGFGPWERLALLAQTLLSTGAGRHRRAWDARRNRPRDRVQCRSLGRMDAHTGDPLWAALVALAGVRSFGWEGDNPDLCRAVGARRWLAHHRMGITRRLARAVPGGDWPDIGRQPYRQTRQRAVARQIAAMLTRPAVLYITRTHIDVYLRLEQIDIAVRLAGLDRDPGWVPELGRVVALHFE